MGGNCNNLEKFWKHAQDSCLLVKPSGKWFVDKCRNDVVKILILTLLLQKKLHFSDIVLTSLRQTVSLEAHTENLKILPRFYSRATSQRSFDHHTVCDTYLSYALQWRFLKPGTALGHRAELLEPETDEVLATGTEQSEERLVVLAPCLVVHLEVVQTCRGSTNGV